MAKWGKNDPKNELILQRWNAGSWTFVEVVGLNGAARKCRTIAKNTGVKHRVWDTGKNEVYCECG